MVERMMWHDFLTDQSDGETVDSSWFEIHIRQTDYVTVMLWSTVTTHSTHNEVQGTRVNLSLKKRKHKKTHGFTYNTILKVLSSAVIQFGPDDINVGSNWQ